MNAKSETDTYVYVAGASAEIERAERMIAIVRSFAKIAYDWTAAMRRHGPDWALPIDVLRGELQRNLDAVDSCEALLVLVPAQPIQTHGAWWECSRAKAWNDLIAGPSTAHGPGDPGQPRKFILVSLPNDKTPCPVWLQCFADHVEVSDELAAAYLRGVVEQRRAIAR